MATTTPGHGSFSAVRYAIELEGAAAGIVVEAQGGEPFADVVQNTIGPVIKKGLKSIHYSDIKLRFSTNMSAEFYKWMAAFVEGTQIPKDGAIRMLDVNFAEKSRLEWKHGLIIRIEFPAADASSKEPGYFSVTIRPESTVISAGSNAKTAVESFTKTKALIPANFRLEIDGLALSRVTSVDSLVVESMAIEPSLMSLHGPVMPRIPNLAFTIVATDANSLRDWFEDFVLKGKNSDQFEKSGSLEFLDPSMKSTMFSIALMGLGIFRFAQDHSLASADSIARVRVELYCESMKFALGTAITASMPSAVQSLHVGH